MKRLRISFYMFLLTFVVSVMAFRFIEGWSMSDAVFMTAITISSVGYGEVQPLTSHGRVITIFTIIFGITSAGYMAGNFVRMLVEGEMSKRFGRKKVEKTITGLKNHYIICGYGRIGKFIARELIKNKEKFLVIDNDPEHIGELENTDIPYLLLDARDEYTLRRAGIMRAKGLVTAVMSDADNVFITLSAKMLRPDIFVLARASEMKNEKKLLSAGANRVVSPYMIGGMRMAQMLIRPTVVDFIDIATMDDKLGLRMEESRIRTKSSYVGKTLIESNLRKDFGVIIVLIKKHNGEMIFNPLPTEVLEENDVLVMLGKNEDIGRINAII